MENRNDMELENLENEDYTPDLISLEDEDGESHDFEIVSAIEEEDATYVALVPVYDEPEESLEEPADLVILKVMEEDGEEFFESIDDEMEFNRISKKFMDSLKDDFDIVE